MDAEPDQLKRIADDLDKVTVLFEQLDERLAPQPRITGTVYLSGRWKLRAGTMYGR